MGGILLGDYDTTDNKMGGILLGDYDTTDNKMGGILLGDYDTTDNKIEMHACLGINYSKSTTSSLGDVVALYSDWFRLLTDGRRG